MVSRHHSNELSVKFIRLKPKSPEKDNPVIFLPAGGEIIVLLRRIKSRIKYLRKLSPK
jgi:hypothetical protein